MHMDIASLRGQRNSERYIAQSAITARLKGLKGTGQEKDCNVGERNIIGSLVTLGFDCNSFALRDLLPCMLYMLKLYCRTLV